MANTARAATELRRGQGPARRVGVGQERLSGEIAEVDTWLGLGVRG
jgi:hypothetical protein